MEDCPLITRYTEAQGIPADLLVKLHVLRQWKTEYGPLPFKRPERLRSTLWNPVTNTDTGVEFRLREYQMQMAQCMCRMNRFINGDSVGLGKTATSITACAVVAGRMPQIKVIVLATKTTCGMWREEFTRFSTLRATVLKDKQGKLKPHEARLAQMREFFEKDDHEVLICKYSSLIGIRKKVRGRFDSEGNPVYGGREAIAGEVRDYLSVIKPHGPHTIMILDECQRFKSVGGATRNMVEILSRPCGRVWALSATVVTNDLSEFYSIASAIDIKPFGSMKEFYEHFCIFRNVFVGRGRNVQKLDGYRHVAEFKAGMRPFFFGRSQRQVKEPLPKLTTRIYPIELNDAQKKLLLHDIPSGRFELPPSIRKVANELVLKERDPSNEFTMLSVFQLVANHPALLDPSNEKEFHSTSLSPKEEALLDMLDGNLRGEKVIAFSKLRSHIDRLEYLTGINRFTSRKFLRITGAESDAERTKARQLFQDPDSGYDLIFINSAATEGVNLQQAGHLILLDLPWSFGQLLQVCGRIMRMASPHSSCTLHILAAQGTIDEYALETLKGKKGLFEKILGESHSAGLLDDRDFGSFSLESGMEKVGTDAEFLTLMKAHVKGISMRKYLKGEVLNQPKIGEQSSEEAWFGRI